MMCFFFFFFFQAEDGIRDHCVTGVQTCALPISAGRPVRRSEEEGRARAGTPGGRPTGARAANPRDGDRRDRKSTLLNSSHTVISYAVFCLKKKTNVLLAGLANNLSEDKQATLVRD